MYKNVNKGKTKSLVFPLKYYIIHFLSRVKTSGQARPLQECDKLGFAIILYIFYLYLKLVLILLLLQLKLYNNLTNYN